MSLPFSHPFLPSPFIPCEEMGGLFPSPGRDNTPCEKWRGFCQGEGVGGGGGTGTICPLTWAQGLLHSAAVKRISISITEQQYAELTRELAAARAYRGSKYSLSDLCAAKLSSNKLQDAELPRKLPAQPPRRMWDGPPPVPEQVHWIHTPQVIAPQPESFARPSPQPEEPPEAPAPEPEPAPAPEPQAPEQFLPPAAPPEPEEPQLKCSHWQNDGEFRCYCIFPAGHEGDHVPHHRIPLRYLDQYVDPALHGDYHKSAARLDEIATEFARKVGP